MVRMMCVENNRKNIRDLEDKVISVEGYIAKIGEKEKTYELTIKNNNIKVLSYIEKKSIGENIWDNLNIGDKIRFKTSLLKFKPSSNLGQFNEYKYYTEQLNYDYKCYIDTYDVVSSYKCGRIYYKISNELYKIRLKISNRINRLYSKTNNIAGVLNAMLLGEKLYLNENTKELYSMAGISHILAISGLHITLIGMGLYRILRNFRINMYMASVLSVGILVLYGIMSGMSVATYRAVFLMCFTLLGKFFYRTVDVGNITVISLLVLLVYNPFLVENTGLQLSYSAILAIVAVSQIIEDALINKKIYIKNREHLYIEEEAGNIDDNNMVLSIADGLNKIYKFALKGIASGISIFIVTLPTIINSFYEIKLFSLGINIIALPLVPIMIMLAIISIISSYIHIGCGMYLAGGVDTILNIYNMLGDICNKVSFNNYIVGHRGILTVLVYYVIFMVGLILIKKYKKPILVLVTVICLFIIILGGKGRQENLRISMLDVSQGDCECIITPNNKVILIDGGSSDEKDLYKYKIMPFLKYMGIDTIDYIVITHTDTDHISGIMDLLCDNTFKINNIVTTKAHVENKYYKTIQYVAKLKNINTINIKTNDIIRIGMVSLKCLHPDNNYESNNNNAYSMTLLLSFNKFNMLFTGDLESDGEEIVANILEKSSTSIEILKVAHHGSKNSSTLEFINAVKPRYALISAGRNNRFGHPHKETLDRLLLNRVKTFVTANMGEIDILSDGKCMNIMTF